VAPELKRAFLDPTEVINWKKCDMFSLGLVFLTVCGVNVEGLNEGKYEEVQNKINKEINQIAKMYTNENPIIKVFRCLLMADPKNRSEFSDLPLNLVSVFTTTPESATEERVKELEKALQIIQSKVKELEISLETKEAMLVEANSRIVQLQEESVSRESTIRDNFIVIQELEEKNSKSISLSLSSQNRRKFYNNH
jgi:hypothetical protein